MSYGRSALTRVPVDLMPEQSILREAIAVFLVAWQGDDLRRVTGWGFVVRGRAQADRVGGVLGGGAI